MHSPEPWKTCDPDDTDYPGIRSAEAKDDVLDVVFDGVLTEEDARRIVACVNACKGIDNPAIVSDAIDFCRAYVRFLDGSTNALCGMAKVARRVAAATIPKDLRRRIVRPSACPRGKLRGL